MKAIIPLAGKGKRLRPLTHTTPKPLIRVAGRPVMSYILDDLAELGVDDIVFVVGYMREAIESYVADAYPDITAHYVVQEVQDGTAGAVKLAEPFVEEEVLILFVEKIDQLSIPDLFGLRASQQKLARPVDRDDFPARSPGNDEWIRN